jgi:methylated-DNA-[protein]-cysteine S-methyltransferase
MNTYHSTFQTRFGPFTAAVDESGALIATAFGDLSDLEKQAGVLSSSADETRTATARKQIAEYLAGRRQSFELPLAPRGTDFQNRVWKALLAIPRGETKTYGELAKRLRSSPRAVGRANATNPICLVIPCHRVIGVDGTLTGFAFGVEIKSRLLALEGYVNQGVTLSRM